MAIAASPFPKPPAVKGNFGADRGFGAFVPSKGIMMSHPAGPPRQMVNAEPGPTTSITAYSTNPTSLPVSNEERNTARNNKARNKLGYHRSSVACGHCRRRKIRCKVDSKSTHGRCESCIKLKRECEFQPVDLQPDPAGCGSNGVQQSKPKNRIIASSRIRSTSSSPAVKHELPAPVSYGSYPGAPAVASCPNMGPPAMGQYESSAILTDRSGPQDVSGTRHPLGYGSWPGSENLSPKHGSGSGFQMGPWKPSSEEAPSLTGFHGFSPQTHHHPTEWPQSMGTVTSGAGSVRVEDEWDPSLHSPARTMSYESEDSAAPHYVMLGGHDPHRGSFDRRSSMGPDMYAPSIVSSSMASPVEAHHAQVGMGPAPRPQGMTGPAYPWLEQQPYPYASKPAPEYGPTWFVNHNNNNSPYHQPAVVKQHLEHGHHVSHAMGEAHYYEGSKRV